MATLAPEIPALARDEAFETLYRQYVKDVYHYALALLRNPADAEDVTQTTFMNAYRAFQRGDEILKPQNWLIKIAHNVARSRYARSTRRVKEVPLEDHVEQLAVPDDERPDIEAVLRALGRLPFNQRAALVMRELEGRSYSEISDTLGVSVPAVETLIFRARRSLRVRASALKSLATIPLPSSLAQLFENGGIVAAGGIGTGIAVKAAMALVVGALATSVGGGHSTPAVAAPQSQAAPNVAAAEQQAAVVHVGAPKPHGAFARQQATGRGRSAGSALSGTSHVASGSLGRSSLPSASGGSMGPTAEAGQAAGASPTPLPAPVTSTVQTITDTVQQTVPPVPVSLPVQPPPLPSLPVEPPPLPPLPKLP
ncbi:MAG: sigma-70 family RNA polymerase sigma factor [Gaiellaceae bacterium]